MVIANSTQSIEHPPSVPRSQLVQYQQWSMFKEVYCYGIRTLAANQQCFPYDGISYPPLQVDKRDLAQWNASFLDYLSSPAHKCGDYAWVILKLCAVLEGSKAVSFVHPEVQFDTDSLCVIEQANSWWSYPGIPCQMDIIVSFKIFCADTATSENIAYFLSSLLRDLFHDGSRSVCVANIAVIVDDHCTVGFIAFGKTRNGWFASVRTTPWFDVVCGWPDAFFSTWPLCNGLGPLGAPEQVQHTVLTARSYLLSFL
ncbi:hypothetical protein BT96DRAFT_1007518 [Gymnopus androsaceus JB14]|uniref:Uncharacterized protein n=1 Tax=Gymnopus androsaceus JB14 TaxID=1447944 RepID=A0A6A4GHG5_9AGAR|nr:hypothetical protein BT96DRAFT_1007518 [Gymnopus androsaceus JB14]